MEKRKKENGRVMQGLGAISIYRRASTTPLIAAAGGLIIQRCCFSFGKCLKYKKLGLYRRFSVSITLLA